MQRLAPHWPPLTAQLGAVPGGQPVEALFAAQHMMAIARVTGKEPIFIRLDIKGAFDNLSHASVASFLATLPAAACHEAMQLMTLLLEQKLRFSFLNEHWDIHCTNGTPQGGSHSAGLFARTLDHAIGGLLSSWEADGYTPAFPPLWLLLFVDDILLCFSDWAEAIRLLPTFLACLSKQGLEVNFSKSCLIASHALPATATRHGTPENVPLGATHAVPSQILWIQFGYGCNAPTSHTTDFWRMGQVKANTEKVTLDIPQHYHQTT